MSATPNATRSFFEKRRAKNLPVSSTRLGVTDFEVSRVGFGCYRIHEFEPDHRHALMAAIRGGVNLIDVSTNYGDGSAERAVGETLNELFLHGEIRREETVVVTKVGYLQGQNLIHAQKLLKNGEGYAEVVEFQDDCWHCISPAFLRDQITQSLDRLKVDSLDVLLLHNPEYFLKAGGGRDVYYRRIQSAFRHLESEVAERRIRYYGISSNTFVESEAKSDFTSLQRIIEIARQNAKDLELAKPLGHFAIIQFPFNLYESGAALLNNNQRQTVLQVAVRENLGTLINRPFNSFMGGRLVRLTSFPTHDQVTIKGSLHSSLGRAIELEKRAPGYPRTPQGLQWAHVLRDRLSDFDDLLSWREALYHQLIPSIRAALERLAPEQQAWANDYQTTMREVLDLITQDLENLAQQKSCLVGDAMELLAPELATSKTLSQKVLRLYQALPEISSILVGMRTPDYVADVLTPAKPLSQETALNLLRRMQRANS